MAWNGLRTRAGWFRGMVSLTVCVVTALVVAAPVGASEASPTGASVGVEVVFEGRPIDLTGDWGDATACLIWNEVGVEECFRTEAEMDKRAAELEKELGLASGGSEKTSYCSGSVKVYDGVVYTGNVFNFRDRFTWINLSTYGFSNKTSSFKIGPCSSIFADYDSGGYPRYSATETEAWDVATVMASGWGNRVSSIYIK